MVVAQARINGQLAIELDSGLDAASVSFLTGLVVVAVIVGTTRSGRAGVRGLVEAVRQRRLVWWQLIGGFLGAYFVWSQSLAVPAVGVALFTVAVVAGQTTNSLVVDRLGIGAIGSMAITPTRVVAAVVGLCAVLVSVAPGWTAASFAWWAIIASIVGGALIAVQQAINGRVAKASGSSWTATALNFSLGALALTVMIALVAAFGEPFHFSQLPTTPWLYLGGPVGVAFIAAAAWVVPILGVLRFGLISIAGQLSGAIALDLIVPTAGSMVTVSLVIGVLLAFLAVVVSARR